MRATFLHRLVLALLPASIVSFVGVSVIWGDSGLLARHRLADELQRANGELAALDRENQRLIRELQLMEQDPLVLERLVAEELGWGRSDAVIVRFDDADGPDVLWPPRVPASASPDPGEIR